jgi:uncharacterized membrane protein YfcA
MEALLIRLPFAGIEFNVGTLIAIGFAVGVLAGFFGIGGGWIVTPALHVFGLPMAFAVGTGFGNVACQGAMATVKHRRMGNVDYALGLTVGLCMMLGVEGGKQVLMWLTARGWEGPVVRWVYIALLAALGYAMTSEALRSRRSKAGRPGRRQPGLLARRRLPPMIVLRSSGFEASLWVLAMLGVLIGFMAGVMGCGGGFALVPAFVYLVGTPTLVAVGTSLLCVVISGAYGTFTYAMAGKLELVAVLWLVVGSFAGTQFGTAATRYVRGTGIRLLYGLMLLVAAAGVLLKQLGSGSAAGWLTLGGAMAMCCVIIARMVLAVRADSAGH